MNHHYLVVVTPYYATEFATGRMFHTGEVLRDSGRGVVMLTPLIEVYDAPQSAVEILDEALRNADGGHGVRNVDAFLFFLEGRGGLELCKSLSRNLPQPKIYWSCCKNGHSQGLRGQIDEAGDGGQQVLITRDCRSAKDPGYAAWHFCETGRVSVEEPPRRVSEGEYLPPLLHTVSRR